jgi:hypothetical protein
MNFERKPDYTKFNRKPFRTLGNEIRVRGETKHSDYAFLYRASDREHTIRESNTITQAYQDGYYN